MKRLFLCSKTLVSRIFIMGVCLTFCLSAAEGKKRNFAVIGVKNAEGVSAGEAEIIADRLRGELFVTGVVGMMEREQMQQILKEQGFQQSGACTDEACMVEIGQLLGVERLISGSIGKLGTMFLVNVRSIDVQTAKIIAVVSVDIKGGIEDVVKYLPNIAKQLVEETSVAKPIATVPVQQPQIVQSPVIPIEVVTSDQAPVVDTTTKKKEAPAPVTVYIGKKDSKNMNRGGIRLSANLFPGEMAMSYWSSSENKFKKDNQPFDNHYYDSLSKISYYTGVEHHKMHLRANVEFLIKAGQYLDLSIGPGFMYLLKSHKYTNNRYLYNSVYRTKEDSWKLNIIAPNLTTGINFVKRFFPLKINVGILVDVNFNIIRFNENYSVLDNYNFPLYTYDHSDIDFKINASFGPRAGVEILAGQHVGFNVDFVYRYSRITTDLNFVSTFDQQWQFTLPGIGVGMGINFYF
jgi:hypothetical protein